MHPLTIPTKEQLLYEDLCVEIKYFAHWFEYIQNIELPENFLKAAQFLKNEWQWLQEKRITIPNNKELELFQAKLKLKEDVFKEKLVTYIKTAIKNNNITDDIQCIFNIYLKNLNYSAYMGSTYIYYINEMAPEKNSYVFTTIAEDTLEHKLESFKKQLAEYFKTKKEDEEDRKLIFLEFTEGHHYQVSSLLKNNEHLDKLNKLLKHYNYKLKITAEDEKVPEIEKCSQSAIFAIEWCEENTEIKTLVRYITKLKNKLAQSMDFHTTTTKIISSAPQTFPKRSFA